MIEGRDARALDFRGRDVAVLEMADGAKWRAMIPEPVGAMLAVEAAGRGLAVAFESEEFLPSGNLTAETLLAVLGNLAIFALLGAMFYFYIWRGPMSNGRSRANLASPAESLVRFADVAGCDAEKQELEEVVAFLKDPDRFSRLGGRVPPGILMSGPPGTGKTLLAKAVAGEAGVPFFSCSGSDFVEMFVGVGAGRVRSMFAKARKKAPCILFVDEIDAVGRSRSSGMGGAHEEREQTLNQLLVEMDGFKPNEGVIVIAATNRPELLDEALTRPGRFSRHIVLQAPDLAGRGKILAVHAAKVTLSASVELARVARGTPGFSGADLANLVNEAAILAARDGRAAVGMREFERAKDRILMGNERRILMNEDDRRLTAFHEAGHALVALMSPASDPIHKVTIVPRGHALGMMVRLPLRDTPAVRRSRLEADLAVAMGGRAAEELIWGHAEVSTGAAGDILMATRLARRMVTEWGMGDTVGMIAHDLNAPAHSEATAREIDAEIKSLVARARDHALSILEAHRPDLHLLAETLLEKESLTGDEIDALLGPARRGALAAGVDCSAA
ncbi:MAG: ATP-dependent zinc metalloprotease FtsH [Alphaproteobacteria bacterium]|nr:ATP-dependent zinc metalloprotease FtsH [Alphaproteobacteria bacterium]